MVVKRRVSKEKYLLAAVLTFLIFSLGLTLGIIIDNARIRYNEKINRERDLNYASLQFQYLYLGTLEEDNESCTVLHVTLDETMKELSKSLDKFLEYEKGVKLDKEEFRLIGRRYLLDNLKYWLFARKTKKTCNLDVVNILYFYSGNNCLICPDQGVILTYFKKIFGEKLLVFPIDVDFAQEEPMIPILKSQYNITQYPTLIIDDRKFEGVIPREKLGKLICSSFQDNQICSQYGI